MMIPILNKSLFTIVFKFGTVVETGHVDALGTEYRCTSWAQQYVLSKTDLIQKTFAQVSEYFECEIICLPRAIVAGLVSAHKNESNENKLQY